MHTGPTGLARLGVLSIGLFASGHAHGTPLPGARRAPTVLVVRDSPSLSGAVWGRVAAGEAFAILSVTPAEDCPGEGWGQVDDGHYVCLTTATPTNEPPVALPRLLDFDPPVPDDYASYVRTGTYSSGRHPALVPFVYGKRWRRWHGQVWSTPAAWLAGEPSSDRLALHHTYSFVRVMETPKGRLFVRANGSVVPADEVFLFPVTEFHGRDLTDSPVPDGAHAAWVVTSPNRRSPWSWTAPRCSRPWSPPEWRTTKPPPGRSVSTPRPRATT